MQVLYCAAAVAEMAALGRGPIVIEVKIGIGYWCSSVACIMSFFRYFV